MRPSMRLECDARACNDGGVKGDVRSRAQRCGVTERGETGEGTCNGGGGRHLFLKSRSLEDASLGGSTTHEQPREPVRTFSEMLPSS